MNPAIVLRLMQRRLGLTGMAGIGLLAAALVAYGLAVMPAQRQANALAQELVRAKAQPVGASAAPVMDDAAKLAVFYKRFAEITTLPLWLESLHKIALEQQLEQIQGEYKLSADEDGNMVRYEIQLPVKGSYLHVRQFMDDAVKRIPNLGLQEVSMKRKDIEQNQVEARITFVLFLLGH